MRGLPASFQGVVVNAHVGRIEDKPNEWYQDFHIIALGLDSLEARRYMNAVICSFLEVPLGTFEGSGGARSAPAPFQLRIALTYPPCTVACSTTSRARLCRRPSSPSSTEGARGSRATLACSSQGSRHALSAPSGSSRPR